MFAEEKHANEAAFVLWWDQIFDTFDAVFGFVFNKNLPGFISAMSEMGFNLKNDRFSSVILVIKINVPYMPPSHMSWMFHTFVSLELEALNCVYMLIRYMEVLFTQNPVLFILLSKL